MEFTAESFIAACREGGHRIESWLRGFDRNHGAALYREAAASLGCWQEAQDVVQEGMIKTWQRCATFQGPGVPIAWIRTIVRRTLLDHLERRKPEVSLHDDDGELTPESDAAVVRLSREQRDTPEDTLGERQVERVFRACFARFEADHPRHAQVLRWLVEDGLTHDEIETLLDRTPGATREFISQCRKKARPYLAPWYALIGDGSAGTVAGRGA